MEIYLQRPSGCMWHKVQAKVYLIHGVLKSHLVSGLFIVITTGRDVDIKERGMYVYVLWEGVHKAYATWRVMFGRGF